MLNRYLAGTAISMAITAALIMFMHYLIEASEAAATDPQPRISLSVGRTIVDTPPVVDRAPPEPPIPPVEPPPLEPPTNPDHNVTRIGIRARSTAPVISKRASAVLDSGNSALFNIISAEPEYPIKASQKGLEGFVVVRFDVSEFGSVENVRVLETSSSLFNQAAIKAAYRARYKPRTIDGVPQRVRGLRKKYVFEMDP
ncbi:MAG: energy transducer TonB [Woeseiaceae bacterium]